MLIVQTIVMSERGAGGGAHVMRELHLASMRRQMPGVMLQSVSTTAGAALAQSLGMARLQGGNSWSMC